MLKVGDKQYVVIWQYSRGELRDSITYGQLCRAEAKLRRLQSNGRGYNIEPRLEIQTIKNTFEV